MHRNNHENSHTGSITAGTSEFNITNYYFQWKHLNNYDGNFDFWGDTVILSMEIQDDILTSYLDDSVRASAGDETVSSSNVSVDEVLFFQVVAAVGYVQRHLDLLWKRQ